MPASVEFSTLCRSQISTVAKAVGAESTAVYLAESWNEQALPKLIPIAVYPAISDPVQDETEPQRSHGLLPGKPSEAFRNRAFGSEMSALSSESGYSNEETALFPLPHQRTLKSDTAAPHQLAIPLVHEGGVMGILVGWKADRPWQATERARMEACAQDLALACVLDQRGQWLQEQLSTLDRLQVQQSDRFHDLLHQLRNPLTAVKTFGQLLVKRLGAESKNQSLAVNMLRESERMQHILGYFDDTLQAADQSRTEATQTVPLLPSSTPDRADKTLEAEALPTTAESLSHFGGNLQVSPCAVATLLAPLENSTRTLAEASGRLFHVFYPEQGSVVQADPKALTEVISNFLENALKYSTAGTHIWLQWGITHHQKPNLEGILVGDTGPGIPKADQPHIFERHYRGIQRSGTISGSGLGLAIAYDLALEMGGCIEVFSPLSETPWLVPDLLQPSLITAGTAFVIWLLKA